MKWIRVLVLGLLLVLLIPSSVLADSSEDVTVTATGYICEAPGGFTITYISDYEIGLSWIKGEDAENTMVRATYGRAPTGRSDGIEIYYGTGTYATHWISNVGLTGPIYYQAWSQAAGGIWEETGSSEEGNFMSASFLFIGLILLAGLLTAFAYKIRMLLFTMAAATAWLALGVWLLLSDSSNLQMSDTWTQIIGFVFVLMTIAVLTLQIRTDIRHEAQVRGRVGYPGAETESYTTWGPKQRKKKPTALERQADYAEMLKGRRGRR